MEDKTKCANFMSSIILEFKTSSFLQAGFLMLTYLL